MIQAFEVANCAVRKDVKIIWDTGLPLLALIFTFSVTLNSNSILISSIFFFLLRFPIFMSDLVFRVLKNDSQKMNLNQQGV